MSSINPNNINGQYPIAGQDNDSQGFRDNFTNIKNNFQFAYNELVDLQNNAVLKGALSGGSLSNDMNYSQLIHAQLLGSVYTKNDLGSKTGSFAISWADAHFQTLTTTGDITITGFTNWPTSGYYTKLSLQITTDTTNRTVTFPSAVSVGLSDIQGASGQTVTLPTAGVYLFELTTYNAGTTITIQDLLRNYDIVTTGASGAFTTLNTTGNIIGGLGQFAAINSTPIGNASASTGAFTTLTTTGNIIGGLGQFAAINSTPIGNASASTGAFTSLSASSITNTGVQIETGYQQIKPTTANVANVSISSTVNRVLIHPTNLLSAFGGSFGANLILPNTQVDGTIISISSNVTMASLSVITPWVGTSVSPAGNTASVAPGIVSRFMFINADKVWYKIA